MWIPEFFKKASSWKKEPLKKKYKISSSGLRLKDMLDLALFAVFIQDLLQSEWRGKCHCGWLDYINHPWCKWSKVFGETNIKQKIFSLLMSWVWKDKCSRSIRYPFLPISTASETDRREESKDVLTLKVIFCVFLPPLSDD